MLGSKDSFQYPSHAAWCNPIQNQCERLKELFLFYVVTCIWVHFSWLLFCTQLVVATSLQCHLTRS